MRISTVTMYEQSMNSLNQQQGEFMRVGQQIATGRKVVNPSDCLLYTSPSPRDMRRSRMPSSA